MNEELEDKEERVDDPSADEDAELGVPVRYTISSYGADYPADGLVERMKRKDIYVPDFQRGLVWTLGQASRFIESLLLGLPVPGIFLFKEPDTGKLVIVDGQQRLRSLQAFYDGVFLKREFSLRGVCMELNGRAYNTLEENDKRRLNDSIIHATVFQQDSPQETDRSSVYQIFERLNTGGTPLSAQEIRSCVSRGSFNRLLQELAHNPDWSTVYGKPSKRGKDQELILRFFALLERADQYRPPMKTFLNTYMQDNRELSDERAGQLRAEFEKTLQYAATHLGGKSFRPERNLNAAVTDALLIGLARRLRTGEPVNPDRLKEEVAMLLGNQDFVGAYASSTTDPTNVTRRLDLATEAFRRVP